LAVHQLFIDFKKAHGSVRWEVLRDVVFEFGIRVKLVVFNVFEVEPVVKYVQGKSDILRIQNGGKQGDALTPLLFNFRIVPNLLPINHSVKTDSQTVEGQ